MKLFQFLVAALLLISSAIVLAEKPDPVDNPPLQVREANIDEQGLIRVHEWGTAKVDIQNTELDVNVTGGEIEVTGGEIEINNTSSNPVPVNVENLPVEQGVFVNAGKLSPVTRYYSDRWDVAEGEYGEHTFENGPIYATSIHISGSYTEWSAVTFESGLFSTGDKVAFVLRVKEDFHPVDTASFMYPIPLDGLRVDCAEAEYGTCHVTITVHGFNPE